jgi:trk system potassium uptake protein TrkH
VLSVKIDGKVKSSEMVDKVTAFMCIYMLLVFIGTLMLVAMDVPLEDSFFTSLSCVSNTGISASIIGHGFDFVLIPAFGKWVLGFLMLVGRLELFTVLLLFSRSFWRK